ncbi:4Fe-4S dicluster domain-containing protein [Fontibacillus panacisegetis]|uniref:4Fe-4S dicluster domain-containing protein n=1 Tax=Fontibacillus solani TaxID=1572857 RepID=UPI0035E40953
MDGANQRKSLQGKYAVQMKTEEKTSVCVECGTCEEQCPQNINIRQRATVCGVAVRVMREGER